MASPSPGSPPPEDRFESYAATHGGHPRLSLPRGLRRSGSLSISKGHGGLGFGRCAPRQTLSSARHFAITTGVSQDAGAALASAEAQVAAARDSPAARLALLDHTYRGPTGPRTPTPAVSPGRAILHALAVGPRCAQFRPHASPPGSPWWRGANERLLRDGCEAVGLAGQVWLESQLPTR